MATITNFRMPLLRDIDSEALLKKLIFLFDRRLQRVSMSLY